MDMQMIGTGLMMAGLGFVVLILAVAVITAIVMWIKNIKKYQQFKIVIWQRDGFGQLKQTFDQGGIFIDRITKNKRLFLRFNKVGLNPDHIPYIQSNKHKTIYLYQTGLKNFHYIDLKITDPQITLTVGEEDVNWAVNDFEKQKKTFDFKAWILQLLPWIAICFVSIIILIIFIYLFREAGTFASAAQSFSEGAQATREMLMYLKTNATMVIPS